MINELVFINAPLNFEKGVKIYPPTVKEVITQSYFSIFRKLLMSSQEDTEDDIEEKNSYSFTIKPASGNFVCSKQLQVYDEFITGASYNTQSGSGYQNGRMVLVAVFGW